MNTRYRVPQTLHEPVQILWFYQDEVAVITLCYLAGMILGGWAWLSLIAGPMIYIRIKRNNPRGFLSHYLIDRGALKLDLYPNNFIHEYHE